jgi:hypothetical protein
MKRDWLVVRNRDSPWSINRLAIDDDWAERLKMNFVLFIQVILFAQNGIANWRESNCQHKNYLRTFISRVLKVNLVRFSFPPFGRRVLPKLFNSFLLTNTFLRPVFLGGETRSKTCRFCLRLSRVCWPVFSCGSKWKCNPIWKQWGIEPRNCFSFTMAINQKRSYMLYVIHLDVI